MDIRNLNGFRVCTKLNIEDNADSRKCFIFINEQWSTIKSVQNHIKNIFNIDDEVNIYIGDVLLPENETIKLIQPSDVLIIRTVKGKKNDLYSNQSKMSPNDNRFSSLSNSLSKKKSEIIPASKRVDLENLLSGCLEELQFKKEQIVKKSVQDIDSISIVNDSNGSEPLFGIPSKKRKRKHKKKSKVLETSSFEETNKSDLIAMDSLDSSSNHIHFSDEDSKEETHDKSTLKVNGNTVEEFRSSLLHLVNKPASQKVFSRKSDSTVTTTPDSEDVEAATLEPTSVNVDEYKSVPIDLATFVPKVGDLISFKKIKLGNDYTPQQSNEIVGEVSTVEESAGSHLVVFTIKEGAEEFEDPTGKFSLACEEKFEGDKILTAEIRWNDVLEPHLKRRV